LDDTPRVATEAELEKILGKGNIDNAKLYCITKIRDLKTTAECYGLGIWPKGTEPYGTDKGNSKINMAMIRSERQCYDKLYPEEMFDRTVDVMDENYIDTPQDSVIQGEVNTISDDEPPEMLAEIMEEQEQEKQKGYVDLQGLEDTLVSLKDKKIKSWSNTNTLTYLIETYHLQDKSPKTPSEAAELLTSEQACEFALKLQGILESA
jgi:hypothetical protein